MWELDYKESWVRKNWCFWTVVLETTLESPLDCKELQPVNPKGNQSWILIGKDPDVGKDWRQGEKETTEDESVMPSNHLILCCLFLLPPSIFTSIRIFSNETALHIRWPKHWRFSFNISPSNEYSRLISFRMDWLDLTFSSPMATAEFPNLLAYWVQHFHCIIF